MSNPKKHHFIPQFILKKFLKGGLIFVYNERTGEISSSPHTKDIFYQNHLYSIKLEDGSRDHQIETDFSKLESDWAATFKDIEILLNKGSQIPLDYLKFIQSYMHLHMRRNPIFKSQNISQLDIQNFCNSRIDEHEAHKQNSTSLSENIKLREKISDPEFIKTFTHNAKAKSSLVLKENHTMRAIENRGLLVAFINVEHKNFIIGDYPFTRLGGNQIDSSGGVLWYILSPKLAVAPYGEKGRIEIVSLTTNLIRHINKHTFTKSSTVASNSEALLKSLARL